jgi:Glutaminase
MPNPNALVDFVGPAPLPLEALAPGPTAVPHYVTIPFQSGRSGRLDLSKPHASVWAGVLDSMRQSNLPAYVEIDPATSEITNLLVPLSVGVENITPVMNDREIELVISHAKHFLRATNPDFHQLLEALERARVNKTLVAVTETADHDIIDIRPLPGTSVTARLEGPTEEIAGPSPAVSVTLAQAQQMFDLVSPKICCPATAAAPCIPFNYPDDGCWARAHEMCRLMIAAGITPNKVWIFGNLRAASQNNPNCQVLWGWHVAPTLSVGAETYVIDPSLFNGPVTQATWAGVQGDPNRVLIPSPASTFWRNQNPASAITDPAYTQTNTELTRYRNTLRVRAVSTAGPPPYANCVPRRPGLQFVGVIPGGATQRWFTFNWPAAWHVVWTVMPLTTCSGAPQLTWKTQVERASVTNATYWIVVTNLTPNAVRFEGRYDVLSH